MKKTLAAFGLFLSLGALAAMAESWEGVISDDACGAMHKKGTQGDKNCASGCIKQGGKGVLVVGDNVYQIENQEAIKGHEGDKVKVTGTLKGDTVHIDSIN